MQDRIALLGTRLRRHGLSPLKLGLGAAGFALLSFLLSGVDGVAFTGALALAYLLGTAARTTPYSLRVLAQDPPRAPVSRQAMEDRIDACRGADTLAGDLTCIVFAVEDFDDIGRKLGTRATRMATAQLLQRLLGKVRARDMVAALGEGRIAALLGPVPDLDLERALQTALRLRTALGQPLMIDGLRLRVTCAAGFCLASRLAKTRCGTPLLDAATLACEAALAQGCGSLRAFDPQMKPARSAPDDVVTREILMESMANGALVPWFQPQLGTDTNHLTGVEALVRWIHPIRGVLAPGQFLDMLEGAGLSARLSDLMLDRSLLQLCEWDRTGLAVPRVSINLGSADLADPTLPRRVAWMLDKHSLAPARLGIEVLETVIARADPDDAVAKGILNLGAMGCFIDMDDFGTGSASITGIRRFGINRLKIDRSLVRDVDKDRDQHGMLAAILTMAGQMNVEVLAEGVETPAEHSAVAQLGCGHVQGFAIARPMSAPDVTAWIARRLVPAAPRSDHNSLMQPPLRRRHSDHGGETA